MVAVFCGSFNPPTLAHTATLRNAIAALTSHGHHVGAVVVTPVHDAYGKPTLTSAAHRVAMCHLAFDNADLSTPASPTSDPVSPPSVGANLPRVHVSAWECTRESRVRSLDVLRHFASLLPRPAAGPRRRADFLRAKEPE